MIMTNEQRNVLTMIMNNKEVIEELLKNVTAQKCGKDLQIGESITVAGITWSKFSEDTEGNAYMLADENILDMEFGENNDWRKSTIRKKLKDELYEKIVDELGTDAVLPIETDLFSHDGLRDYGKCEDVISILTYDLYRNNRENIKESNEWYWTCTPDSTPSGESASYVRCVRSYGSVDCGGCGYYGGVRPFFILKAERSDAK